MNIPIKRIEALDIKVSSGLENLEDRPAVKDVLLAGGYTQADLDDIKRVQTELKGYYNEKESKNRTKKSLTAQIAVLRKKLGAHYANTAKALKLAFQDDDILLEDLGLRSLTQERLVVFLEKARDFYTKAGDDKILEKSLGYGVSMDSLLEGVKLIDDIETLVKARLRLQGEKEAATIKRNSAYRELNKKWRSLAETLKRLFKDQHHMVEGIIEVPAEGFGRRRKKKGASEDPAAGGENPAPDEPVVEEPVNETPVSEESDSQETGVDVAPVEA